MNVVEAHARGLTDEALIEFARRNLVTSQKRIVLAVARSRGLHGFAHVDQSIPEMCLCGAAFVDGYHLDAVKRAHLEAVVNG